MEQLPRDMIFEILKHVKTRLFPQFAASSKLLNKVCKQYIKTRNLKTYNIQINETKNHLKCFVDDDLETIDSSFISKRPFSTIYFYSSDLYVCSASAILKIVYREVPLYMCNKIFICNRIGEFKKHAKSETSVMCFECGFVGSQYQHDFIYSWVKLGNVCKKCFG